MAKDKKKRQKIRADFRKNRQQRSRERDLTRRFEEHGFTDQDESRTERVSGKGKLSRKRTVVGDVVSDELSSVSVQPQVDEKACISGRVLRVHGLNSIVQAEDGQLYRCAIRRLLKTLTTDARHVVAAGDRVLLRASGEGEGIIERIESRHGVLCRSSRAKRHIMVANVDQLMIITSAAEPDIKPNLIDRMLVTSEKARIEPIICINKIDLVDAANLQPLIGVYGQLGYTIIPISAKTGFGIDRLRHFIRGRESVFAGQSGVGKSSLLNAIEPGLGLRIRDVSSDNEKGRHTTTTAELIPLTVGGYVVDTPGIRQFQLWDVIPEEVAGYFRDVRPFVSQCRYPDCMHLHETDCSVKDAVADGRIDPRRYQSYCRLVEGD